MQGNQRMSGLELSTATSVMPWVVWEPLTPGDLLAAGMTVVFGTAALSLAAIGLWQMRVASTARNRQLDAMLAMLDERTAALTRGLETVTRGLETVIERAAPGSAGREMT